MRLFLFSLLAAGALLGQTFTGSILGTVTDTSGAAIAGATETAVNDATGESRTAQSSQVGLLAPFAQFGMITHYTFGKSLTDARGTTGIFSFNQPAIQNYCDLRGEKALSPSDVSTGVVFSFGWQLPIGKVNGLGSMQTGLPLTLTTLVNQTNASLSSGRSLNQWFNTAAFSQPAPFTYGNVSRSLPSTRRPGLQEFDISLFKNNRIGERFNLQFRFEAFNILNRANFGAPGTVFGHGRG